MDRRRAVECFATEWIYYLEQHGHEVTQAAARADVLRSCNGRGTKYRWLLRSAENDSLLLAAGDRKDIRRQLRLARRGGEQCFLVVKFEDPGGTALVLPATEALQIRRLRSDTGGIPWDC